MSEQMGEQVAMNKTRIDVLEVQLQKLDVKQDAASERSNRQHLEQTAILVRIDENVKSLTERIKHLETIKREGEGEERWKRVVDYAIKALAAAGFGGGAVVAFQALT